VQRHLASAGAAGYKRPMLRRPHFIGIPARRGARGRGPLLVLLFVLVCGSAYAAYWWIAAARIEREFGLWVRQAHADKLEVSWRDLHVGGFPAAFRLELKDALFRYGAADAAPVFHVPALAGSARPWEPTVWRLTARRGLTAAIAGAGGRAPIKLAARSATGTIFVHLKGGATLWLTVRDAAVEAGEHVGVGRADSWVLLPPRPPHAQGEPHFGIALRLRRVRLPVAVVPLGDTIDDLSAGLTIRGALPPGPLAKAVSAWRDDGGLVALDHVHLRWGALTAAGAGTMTLDRDLQPLGGFSGAVEGYDEILAALVQSGRMRAEQAGLARLALTMLAKAGPDGRPEIATSFTIEHGQMYLGPARLGPAPRIAWE
jgi:hypothetical protein